MNLDHKIDVAARRREEYPGVGDQLDALVALAEALKEQGFVMPTKTQEWLDSCNEVKANVPKV